MAEYQGGDDIQLGGFYNSIVQNLYKNQALAQVKQEKTQKSIQATEKEISDLVGKVNPSGVQQKDIPEFSKQWDEVKELNFKASKATSPTEARLIQAEMQGKIKNVQMFIDRSKRDAQDFIKASDEVRRNPWAYDGETQTKLKTWASTPSSKIDPTVFNINSFIKEPDANKVTKLNQDIFAKQKEGARNNPALRTITQKDITAGNKKGVMFQTVANANLGATIERMKQEYSSNGEYKAYYDMQAKKNGIPVEQLIAQEATGAQQRGDLSWIGAETRTFNNVPRSSGGSGKVSSEETYRQQLIKGIMSNDEQSMNELLAYLPQGATVTPYTSVPSKTSKGGYRGLKVNIPSTVNGDGSIIRGVNNLDISFSKGDAVNQLNSLISKHTGEVIKASKVNIEGGKPRGKKADFSEIPKKVEKKSVPSQKKTTVKKEKISW